MAVITITEAEDYSGAKCLWGSIGDLKESNIREPLIWQGGVPPANVSEIGKIWKVHTEQIPDLIKKLSTLSDTSEEIHSIENSYRVARVSREEVPSAGS
jgi:hypothetical protein